MAAAKEMTMKGAKGRDGRWRVTVARGGRSAKVTGAKSLEEGRLAAVAQLEWMEGIAARARGEAATK